MKRNQRITVRLTDADLSMLRRAARQDHRNVADFVRISVLRQLTA